MGIKPYAVGQGLRPTARITQDGVPVDPATVTISVNDPDDHATDYVYGTDADVVKDATGFYHLNLTVDTPGTWTYRWLTTNPDTATVDREFTVTDTIFT